MDYGQIATVTRHSSWSAFQTSPERAQGRLLLFTTRAAQPFTAFEYRPGDLLMMGRESAGVPDDVHDSADERLFVPLMPGARSLNVTVTAAIALSQALQATGQFPSPGAGFG